MCNYYKVNLVKRSIWDQDNENAHTDVLIFHTHTYKKEQKKNYQTQHQMIIQNGKQNNGEWFKWSE